jgi:lipid A 4'-phosphatase
MPRYLKLLLPLIIFALLSPFLSFIDMKVAHFFYVPASDPLMKGHFFENGLTSFLYTYGEQIGFFVGAIATAIFLLSFVLTQIKTWRRGALVMILTLVLGAGLLINSVLKEYWGRPRPKQVEAFGGHLAFRPFYSPNFDPKREPQKSFPSGHVAIGFYYLSLCVVAKRYNNYPLFILGIVLTVVFGGGLFFSRVAQGGHFVTDALCSILIMWYAALFADFLVYRKNLFFLSRFLK